MQNKAILLSTILFASSSVLAETSLLEGVAKEVAKDTATAVAPDTVEKLDAANQTLKNASKLKESVEQAPDALIKNQEEQAKETVNKAVPNEVTKAAETVKSGTKTVKNLQKKVTKASKSTKTIKGKAEEKALEMLH